MLRSSQGGGYEHRQNARRRSYPFNVCIYRATPLAIPSDAMNRGFEVDRYGEFLGRVPEDILQLVPIEDQRGFFTQLVENAEGKIVTGWKVTDSGIPYPIFSAKIQTHATW